MTQTDLTRLTKRRKLLFEAFEIYAVDYSFFVHDVLTLYMNFAKQNGAHGQLSGVLKGMVRVAAESQRLVFVTTRDLDSAEKDGCLCCVRVSCDIEVVVFWMHRDIYKRDSCIASLYHSMIS